MLKQAVKLAVQNFQPCLKKDIHASLVNVMMSNNVTEIKIPVPWGHIAGKWWGNTDKQPVLALHGVQDNAATFDTLIPLLQVHSVLVLDITGHGSSSHLPIGWDYHLLDAVTAVRYVIKNLYNWQKPILLGHSFGSMLWFIYSSVFPDEVDKYISIDCARHQMTYRPDNVIEKLRTTVDKALDIELKPKNPPQYTEEQLLELFYLGRNELIPKDACKVLLSRGVTKLENGKCFLSRDIRVKLPCYGRLSFSDLLEMSTYIKCNVLSIAASNGGLKKDWKGDIYMKTIENINKNSVNSKFLIIDGRHHLHFEEPQKVADAINAFLSS